MGDANNDSFDDIFNDRLTRYSTVTSNWANQASVAGKARFAQPAPSTSQMQQKYNTDFGDAMVFDADRTQRQVLKSAYKPAETYKPASYHSRLTSSMVF